MRRERASTRATIKTAVSEDCDIMASSPRAGQRADQNSLDLLLAAMSAPVARR